MVGEGNRFIVSFRYESKWVASGQMSTTNHNGSASIMTISKRQPFEVLTAIGACLLNETPWSRIHESVQPSVNAIHTCETGMTKLPENKPSMAIAMQAR